MTAPTRPSVPERIVLEEPPAALVLDSVSYRYPGTDRNVIEDLNLTLPAGLTLAVQGPSGCGKSTVLALAGLILAPTAGTITIAGADSAAGDPDALRRHRVGTVLQDLGLLPFLNTWENVAAAFGPRLARHREQARAALSALDMADLADRPVQELSGGQRQRVAIARAAVHEPALILADEPTSGLDEKNGDLVMEALLECAARGTGVLVVTHDPRIADRCARASRLVDGRLTDATPAGPTQEEPRDPVH
ncbi:ABC transporter ATP-binding protein [Streptomyces sp. CC228A]|uniref:ABC transporter ATP-binding protein n=1 Tax=Streptomyces sp. CC228A TaxID=2898186 RepID=UPI001F2FE9E8|nr:ATP-binding cassette domain-containing protein [Streptomyces sp. CC228A]